MSGDSNIPNAGDLTAIVEGERPETFGMKINGGILESLGINMYTSIGKCLVEFVANAYDSDAPEVNITIPWPRIRELIDEAKEQERERKAEARKEAAATPASDTDADTVARNNEPVMPILPDDVVIKITDTGHGMSPHDVRTKFMAINRKRRANQDNNETNNMSESGRRQVMGRKGLGKLAGFGAAEVVEIRTKRRGETFATTFRMELENLQNAEDVSEVAIPASYEDGLPAEEQGTTVFLRRVKRGAVSRGEAGITDTISNAFFGIDPQDFAIKLNEVQIKEPKASYEYVYSPEAKEDDFTEKVVEVEGEDDITIRYKVMFRARKVDPDNPDLKYGPLAANKRGARIYCNRRLAAGPTLLDLKTGMHNFYASEYMECLVEADELDRRAIDYINTNRTQLREDNETVNAFHAAVSEILRLGILHHSKWREQKVEQDLDKKTEDSRQLRWILGLPMQRRKAARSVLKAVAVQHDIESEEFEEIAPLLMNAVNASDIFIRLIELRTSPSSLEKISMHLSELADLERRDMIMHYRGRRNAILALRDLIEKGEKAKKSDPRTEKLLHKLLKENPWLVRPDFSTFVTSDRRMTSTLSKLANLLGVDEFADPHVPEDGADATRPDLVFLLADSGQPNVITIVELKSPTLPLEIGHLLQLKRYMRQTEDWIQNSLHRTVSVHGLLVGKMPKIDTSNVNEQDMLDAMKRRGSSEDWEVVGLQAMLERTRNVHEEMIKAIDAEEGEDEEAADAKQAAE